MPPTFSEKSEHPRRPGRLAPGGCWAAFLALGLAGSVALGQENGEVATAVVVDPVPQNFELWQDDEGFLWQVNRQGALGSGDTAYFQSALALFVRGVAFTSEMATRLDGGAADDAGARLVLEQGMEGLRVTRDLWFDRARAGVRVVDVFENTGARRETFRIELKTAYQNPWQDLHGSEGRILGGKPGAGLGARDFGLVVKFSAAEGRHDTLIITSSERDAMPPMVSYSSNLRELTLSHDLEIEPGQKAALLHWVAQRNLQSPGDAEGALRPFYHRRQLANPGLPEDLDSGLVRNFDAQSFPAPGVTPHDLEALVSLNRVTEALGIDRRGDDLLWISAENQLAGTVNGKASLRVKTQWGERETAITAVAAIQGGAGLGRTPRVFLRDGRVWAGEVVASDLTMKIAEGWEVEELRPAELSLLLLRVGENDGRPPEGTGLFVELRGGDVLAVAGGDERTLHILTPWGEDEVAFSRISELAYASGSAAPRYRLRRDDGSVLTVFLGGDTLEIREAGSKEGESNASLTVAPVAVAAARKPGPGSGLFAGDHAAETDWYDLEEAASFFGDAMPASAVLLSGDNLLAGAPAMESLNLVSGTAVTAIDPAELVRVRRSLDNDSDESPVFEMELNGGEILTGRLRERMLLFESGGKRWRVPTAHFLGFHRKEAKSGE